VKGDARVEVFGWICVAFSISVFAAPLSIMVNIRSEFNDEPYVCYSCPYIWLMYEVLLTLVRVNFSCIADESDTHKEC